MSITLIQLRPYAQFSETCFFESIALYSVPLRIRSIVHAVKSL